MGTQIVKRKLKMVLNMFVVHLHHTVEEKLIDLYASIIFLLKFLESFFP